MQPLRKFYFYKPMSYKVQPLAWLPNTAGYPFVGILKDGTRVKCRVVKGDDGTFRVSGAEFADLAGWVRA